MCILKVDPLFSRYEEQNTILLNKKTGDPMEYQDEQSQSDNRSTNISCTDKANSELQDNINEKEFKVPKKKAKIDRKILMAKIGEEWKLLPENKKAKYRRMARNNMNIYKQQK